MRQMPATAEQITNLCNGWLAAAVLPNGGFALNQATEQFRLHANNVVFHEIDFDALCAAIAGLTKTVLMPGHSTIVDWDHLLLWSWCAELLYSSDSHLFQDEQRELRNLLSTTMHCALLGSRDPNDAEAEFERQRTLQQLEGVHTRHLIHHHFLALAYLAFPLLEGLIKLQCEAFVAMDGSVISDFDVPKRGQPGRNIEYRVDGPKAKCSSIRDLLILFRTTVAEATIAGRLDDIFNRLNELEGKLGPDAIADWRNSSLHGNRSFPTIAGTVIGCALLVAFNGLSTQYGEARLAVLGTVRQRQQGPEELRELRESFYPPW